MSDEINMILEDIKANKSRKTQLSLDKLNALLQSRFDNGEKDYSIATIGRVSKANGGIGTVSIRNASGKHFRDLIEAWASKANTTMKKPPVSQSRQNDIPVDMDILKRVDDPALRVIFGQIIAERNRLRVENRTLKSNSDIVIDMRPKQEHPSNTPTLTSPSTILVESEITALVDAIDDERMLYRGWEVTTYGSVKDMNGDIIFKAGFVKAIEKILASFRTV